MQTANVAADVVGLFERQTPCFGSVRIQSMKVALPINDKIKVTKKGKIKITKIGYFFDCQK